MTRVEATGQRSGIGGGQVSGTVAVSGAVSIESGLVAVLSGDVTVTGGVQVSGTVAVSGEVRAEVSGDIVDIAVPTSIPAAGIFVVGSQSGGVILTSGSVISVTIKAMSDNSGNIYVAGVALQSGEGFVLEPGEAINIDIDNMGRIHLLADVSGDRITYLGVA